jgi:hypothetical protein
MQPETFLTTLLGQKKSPERFLVPAMVTLIRAMAAIF